MKLTLSFDNGPHPEVTPRVLDALALHGVRAHFFVLGKHLEGAAGRDLVARAIGEGHLVGNHSYTHEIPLGDDPRPDAVERELAATEALLAPLSPGGLRFRPFGGGGLLGPHLLSAGAVAYLCERGYSCILWNSVPRDWVDPEGWPAVALRDLARVPHTVLVLHDIPGACLAGLELFLQQARASGAEFVLDAPSGCMPIEGGRIVGDLGSLVASPRG